jgi:hypothetical protein
MAYTQKELEAFVKDLDLPADKAKAILDAMGSDEKVLNKFGDNVLRQSDYSAKLNALQAEKAKSEKELQERIAKEDQFHASLGEWKTKKEKEAEAAIAQAREEAEDRLAAVQARIKAIAQEEGISEDKIKDLVTARPNETRTRKEPAVRDPETGKWVSQDEFNNKFRREGVEMAKLIPIMNRLEKDYRKLFGDDAPDVDYNKLIDVAASKGRKLSEVFEDEYHLSAKRKELDDNQRKKDLEDAERRGAESARSKLLSEHPELSSRQVTRERQGSAILDVARKQVEKGAPPARKPGEGVEAAVNAFRSGKYKDGIEHVA